MNDKVSNNGAAHTQQHAMFVYFHNAILVVAILPLHFDVWFCAAYVGTQQASVTQAEHVLYHTFEQ